MSRASLLQLTTACRTLHQRFPQPASLELRLLPPLLLGGADPGGRGSGGRIGGEAPCDGASAADAGWHGSTAVMSYFLSELGVATSVTALLLQVVFCS